MIIGVDPGFKGGIAAIDSYGVFIAGSRTPIESLDGRDMISSPGLTDFLRALPGSRMPTDIVIEEVHSMPRQGVASTFKFGRAAGAVEAWALDLPVRLRFVSPQRWKGAMNVSSDKRACLEDAARRWPYADVDWGVLRNDGIAEAALIAEYLRTHAE